MYIDRLGHWVLTILNRLIWTPCFIYLQLVWRLCTEILHHHPNSTLQDYNNIYERMKHSSSKHYLMVRHSSFFLVWLNLITNNSCLHFFLPGWTFFSYVKISLEHAFHLMLHGCIEDAKHQLSVAQTWRYGKESVIQYQKTKLIHAYSSLLDYINWCDKKSANDGCGETVHNSTAFHHLASAFYL